MISATARNLTPANLVLALVAIALIAGTRANLTCAQDNPVPAEQVTEMVTRVRAATSGQTPPTGAIPLAQALLIQRRYDEAYVLFAALLEKLPREAVLMYGAALASFNLGHSSEAEPLARAAVEVYLSGVEGSEARSLSPERRQSAADALVLLAVILGARGDDRQALKTVERAVALAPDHYDAQFTLGRALYSVGDSAAAVSAFRAALRIKPDNAQALFFLATTLESAGDSEAALNAYRDLARRYPQSAEGHLGLGVLLVKRGGTDTGPGIEALRTALRLDPNRYEAQVTLGRALLTKKLAAESVAYLQRAAELAPTNPEPHYQLAIAYHRLGLYEKAAAEAAIVKRIHEARRGEGAQNSNTARPRQ